MTEHSPQPSEGKAAWLASAATVLRRSGRLATEDPDKAAWAELARRVPDGVEVPPIGAPADVEALPTAAALAADPGAAPFLRGSRPTAAWDVRALIADADPARARGAALADLAGGVASLWIAVGDGGLAPTDLAAALDGVDLTIAPVVLDPAPGSSVEAGRALAAVAAGRGASLHPASSLGADPIGAAVRIAFATDERAIPAVAPMAVAAAELATDLGVGAIVVDGTVLHDAGALDAQEIGYTLAAGATYLRILTGAGLDIDTACRLISFRYAVTDEQFTQIAKLRAARLAWARVCELSGASPQARAQHQHAVTSAAMVTRYDAHTNMLRGTIATFAAAVGGADAITTLPFDSALGEPDGFARRMARNVSALLTGESGLDRVTDPAGGAAAVEMLTARLAHSAWDDFTSIESSGGIEAAVVGESLTGSVARARADRDRLIATRRQPITGVSEFPDPTEPPQHAEEPDSGRRPADRRWADFRWAQPFEALRDDPAPAPVLLVRVGSQARAAARMLFTENLLSAGGVRFEHAQAAADLANAVAESGCRTVVVAGADAAYAEDLAGVLRAARDGGAASVFLAGRPRKILAELPDGLLDGTVAAGDDVLKFLRTVRATLGVAS